MAVVLKTVGLWLHFEGTAKGFVDILDGGLKDSKELKVTKVFELFYWKDRAAIRSDREGADEYVSVELVRSCLFAGSNGGVK